jgi:hypothetical protein
LIEAERKRNKSILRRITKTSLLELCEENSVGEFHLFEECQEAHCLIAKQVFRLMTDLVQKCSEIDPRFERKLLWTGSNAEGTKMWLPDEFDFLMELVGLRGNCEYDNSFVFSSELFVKKECQKLWSNLCFTNKDSPTLSPLKLQNRFSILVNKAVSLLDKNKYQNIRFDDRYYLTLPSYYLKMFLFNYLHLEKNGSNAKTVSECLDFSSSFCNGLHRLSQIQNDPARIPHFFATYNLLLSSQFDMRWCILTLAAIESL